MEESADPNVCDITNSWTYFWYANQDLVLLLISLVVILLLAIIFAKRQQKKYMKVNNTALENQKRIVELLEEISNKLSK